MRLQLAIVCLMAQVIYTKPIPQGEVEVEDGAVLNNAQVDALVNVDLRSVRSPADGLEAPSAPAPPAAFDNVPIQNFGIVRARDIPPAEVAAAVEPAVDAAAPVTDAAAPVVEPVAPVIEDTAMIVADIAPLRA